MANCISLFLVGMCRADFTRRPWNWNEGLNSMVIGTEKGGKLVSGTKIWANFELVWADFELILGYV